jgi:hypothetical protein
LLAPKLAAQPDYFVVSSLAPRCTSMYYLGARCGRPQVVGLLASFFDTSSNLSAVALVRKTRPENVSYPF